MYLPRRFFPILGAVTIAAAAHCHAGRLDSTIAGRTPGSAPTSYDMGAVARNGDAIPGDTNKLATAPVTAVVAPRIAASIAGGTGGDRSFIVVADLRPRKNFSVNPTILSAFSCLAALGLMFYPHVKQRAGR